MTFTSIEAAKLYRQSTRYLLDTLLDEENRLSNRIEDVTNKLEEVENWIKENTNA